MRKICAIFRSSTVSEYSVARMIPKQRHLARLHYFYRSTFVNEMIAGSILAEADSLCQAVWTEDGGGRPPPSKQRFLTENTVPAISCRCRSSP